MKLSRRLLSLLLVCFVCFGLFSVNALAVEESENLVDSNMSNWVDCGETLDAFQTADISSNGTNNIITVERNTKGIVILYDLTEFLKVGESYQFSFTLPDTNSTGLNYYSLGWTLANSVDGPVAAESRELVYVKNSNKSNYLGKTTTFEFTYTEGYKNTCIALYIWGNDDLSEFPLTTFYINDVSLIRVTTESEKKLDGILVWLEDIKNSITGLGDKLTSVWENITASVSSLGDRISGFFSELSNTISTKFNELTTNFSNFITNLGDRISGFFDNLITNVKTFFEELPGKIFNYQIEEDKDGNITGSTGSSDGDDTSTNNSLISINNLYEYSFGGTSQQFLFIEDSYARYYQPSGYSLYSSQIAIDNVPISLDMNTEYKLSFNINNYVNSQKNNGYYPYIQVKFSDSQYNFKENISKDGLYEFTFSPKTPVTIDSIIIGSPPIFLFECLLDISDLELVKVSDDSSSGDDENTVSVSWFQFIINKFKSWFSDLKNSIESFFIKLFEDIKSLFIPSDGYFDDLANRFDLLIKQRFGALVTITDYLVEFFSSFNADVTKEFFDVPIININLMGYNFPIGGWQVRFVPQFNGVEILTNACKFISSVLATFAFFEGLKNKYHEVFGGGE